MKAMIKKVVDAHNLHQSTKRQKQNKVPSKSCCRKGTKTAARMKTKRAIQSELAL